SRTRRTRASTRGPRGAPRPSTSARRSLRRDQLVPGRGDAQGPQPAELAVDDRHVVAELDQLRLGEVGVEALPDVIVRELRAPGDGARVGERRLLPLVVAISGLEVEQLLVIALAEPLLAAAAGALAAAVQALDGPRHVDPAELLDRVVADPLAECRLPLHPEVAQRRRHVGANRLALRPGGPMPRRVVEDRA